MDVVEDDGNSPLTNCILCDIRLVKADTSFLVQLVLYLILCTTRKSLPKFMHETRAHFNNTVTLSTIPTLPHTLHKLPTSNLVR